MVILYLKSKKHGVHICMFDESDQHIVEPHKWRVVKNRQRFYAITSINGRNVRMHRMLISAEIIDHIDGNGLNNTRKNLREATNSENLWNRGPSITKKGIYKGVYRDRRCNSFYVSITANKKVYHGGSFSTPEAAALRYNELSKQLHGEFAYQNQIR